MFLHLGDDNAVLKRDIVGIFDIKTIAAKSTKEFMEIAKDEGFIIRICQPDKEKSIVITNKDIYISPISCNTLKKRAHIRGLAMEVND